MKCKASLVLTFKTYDYYIVSSIGKEEKFWGPNVPW